MFEVTKEIKWCMAHRLKKGYEGLCTNNHGHSYKVLITFKSELLNEVDMVVDFKEINLKVKKWIDDNWDHATLVYKEDKSFLDFCNKEKMKFYFMPENTTAEEMSRFLYKKIQTFGFKVKLESVTIYETDTSFCKYSE